MSFPQKRIDTVVDGWLENITRQAEERSGITIRAELAASVGKVIKRELLSSLADLPADGLGRYVNDKYYDDTIHIRDWLVGAVMRGDHWLRRRNDGGVPFKLAKFGRMEQIVDEADKAMRKLNSRGVAPSAASEIIHDFGNGYTIVDLRTGAELEAESRTMQHCVGQGGYHAAVQSGATKILSLRDRTGKAHATIEVDVPINAVAQVKGKQNRTPKAEYFDMIAEWIHATGYLFTCSDCPYGYAADRHGKIVKLSSLAPGDTFDGNLHIDLSDDGRIPELPEGLVISGSLTIRADAEQSPAVKIPGSLKIESQLMLSGLRINQSRAFPGDGVYFSQCVIERLPPAMKGTISFESSRIGGDDWDETVFEGRVTFEAAEVAPDAMSSMKFLGEVSFHNGSVTIPDGMSFAANLSLVNSQATFNGSLDVGGELVVNGGGFVSPPRKLTVGKSFRAHRTSIPRLPGDMTIGDAFVMSDTVGMEVLPREAIIGGDICFDHAAVRSLDGRTIFNGDLFLNRCPLTELARGATVRYFLQIADTKMAALPEDLTVGESVTIGAGAIREIPDTLRFGDSLVIGTSEIYTLPSGLNIPGNLDISSSRAFRLPAALSIGGALLARKSELAELPSDLKAYSIFADGSSLACLPDGLALGGDLSLRSARIAELPNDLSVGGNADFRDTRIERIQASIFIGGFPRAEPHVIWEGAPILKRSQTLASW